MVVDGAVKKKIDFSKLEVLISQGVVGYAVREEISLIVLNGDEENRKLIYEALRGRLPKTIEVKDFNLNEGYGGKVWLFDADVHLRAYGLI